MAATFSPDARGSPPPERLQLLRELGAQVVPVWAALDSPPEGSKQLVVVERIERGGLFSDQEIADWVRDARQLETLDHPNVGRVRDVIIRGDEVLVVSDFIEGVRWSELSASPAQVERADFSPEGSSAPDVPPLEIALRVLVDVLSGLSALHNLRNGKREPLHLFHAEVTPEHIVVGVDGVARVINPCRVKSARARRGHGSSAYLAPEILLEDESADARCDVYSAGALLWEALTGRSLFPNMGPSTIVTALLSGRLARATVAQRSPWAAPLADVAARALAADPGARFPSAAALAAELRRIAGVNVPLPAHVADFVLSRFGERIHARRSALERGETSAHQVSGVAPPPSSPPASVESLTAEDASFVSERPSSRPTPLPRSNEVPQPPAVHPRLLLRSIRTLHGVAPPVLDCPGPGGPVVVPSSRPPPPATAGGGSVALPTPMVGFEISTAARMPIEPTALHVEQPSPPEPPPLPSVPALPPLAVPPRRVARPGRRRRLVALILPIALVLAVLVSALALIAHRKRGVSSKPRINGSNSEPLAAPTGTAISTSTSLEKPVLANAPAVPASISPPQRDQAPPKVCVPPYTIDPKTGIKHWKIQCL